MSSIPVEFSIAYEPAHAGTTRNSDEGVFVKSDSREGRDEISVKFGYELRTQLGWIGKDRLIVRWDQSRKRAFFTRDNSAKKTVSVRVTAQRGSAAIGMNKEQVRSIVGDAGMTQFGTGDWVKCEYEVLSGGIIVTFS